MEATNFESRHQQALHLMVVALASLAYLGDRVDIVWALVRNHSDSASWERLVFGCGALMLLGSAILETWANAPRNVPSRDAPPLSGESLNGHRQQYGRLARVLLVLAVGLLLPLSGTVILLAGETILLLRLSFRKDGNIAALRPTARLTTNSWSAAFRAAGGKWGLSVSMIIFAWTLQDRLAEIGAVCSVILWLVLNTAARQRSHGV